MSERAREWVISEVAQLDALIGGMDAVTRRGYVAVSGPHAALAALDRLAESERVRRLLAEALGAIQWSGYAMIGAEPCPNCGSERDESHSDGCIVGVALAESGALDQKTGEA